MEKKWTQARKIELMRAIMENDHACARNLDADNPGSALAKNMRCEAAGLQLAIWILTNPETRDELANVYNI